MIKRNKSGNRLLAKFAFPSSFLRIVTPLFIFQFPLVVTILNWLLDFTDHIPYRSKGFTREKYEFIDKNLDFYWYTISLIYSYNNLPFFGPLLVLYVFRLIGQLIFYKTRDERIFILFPNFYEFVFWLLILVRAVPSYSYLIDPQHLSGVLTVLFIAKFIQELIAHKFDKYYYPFVPDWIKAPE